MGNVPNRGFRCLTVVRDFVSLIKTPEPCSYLRQAAADAMTEIAMKA
jgi:hypothetical protein